ncbi:flagellar export chaperone FliS [Paenibacillus thiaminolyticus]|uniref:flagellar export chaperone FliS n=1 Tax=Paenibacillus thiaminolyticus TaxID=49283 RepID=UPI0035A5FB8B
MNSIAGYQAYQKNKYETASPHRLILMLYSGAIKYLKQTNSALEAEDYSSAHEYNLKVQDILFELISSLNEREGGEMASNLKQLYLYMIDQLVQSNINKSVEPLGEIYGMLESIKDAWETIGKEMTAGRNYA